MIPKKLNSKHFKLAAAEIDRQGVPAERNSVRYDLVIEGKRYPPKYIVSLATIFATGEEYPASDFNAVEAKNYFLRKGYKVIDRRAEAETMVAAEDDESAFPEGRESFKTHRHLERDGKIPLSAEVFDNNEGDYRRWLQDNPDGYVLTTVREIAPNYMSLHRASCRMISQYMKNMAVDAFTGRRYIKICSRSTSDLVAWINKHGGKGFTKSCSICTPDPEDGVANDAERYYSLLDTEVSRSRGDSLARKARLKIAPRMPVSFTTTTTIFRRNPDVIAEVLERANGSCEKCRKAAPFKRASDGSPYLEVHHQIPLAEGGEDAIENALALCPNCHRESHFGECVYDG